jgi:hypothetical protein
MLYAGVVISVYNRITADGKYLLISTYKLQGDAVENNMWRVRPHITTNKMLANHNSATLAMQF